MKTNYRSLFLATASLLAACAQPDPGPAPQQEPTVTSDVAVSSSALAIEKAERILDRGGDASEARALLDDALVDANLSDDERVSAVVAQSRAEEALAHPEEAIAAVERELAAHAGDHRYPVDRLRKRLKELLVEDDEPDYVAKGRKPAPPFARMLGKYFPADDDGRIHVDIFTIGGDRSVREEVGTFNVGEGLRAEMEEGCPLCDVDLSVSSSVHGGDWIMIPSSQDQFDDALVVLYYDLEHNRIPARYASLLPLPLEQLDQALADGKSLTVADERPGAPPILLIAAPRTAMLADVERQVAMLDELPVEPRILDVNDHIRPDEIRAIVRGAWIPDVRSCYETLRETAPEAEGRVVAELVIDGRGAVQKATVTTDDRPLEVGSFLSCVEESATKLPFPAIGGSTTVRYPLVLNTK